MKQLSPWSNHYCFPNTENWRHQKITHQNISTNNVTGAGREQEQQVRKRFEGFCLLLLSPFLLVILLDVFLHPLIFLVLLLDVLLDLLFLLVILVFVSFSSCTSSCPFSSSLLRLLFLLLVLFHIYWLASPAILLFGFFHLSSLLSFTISFYPSPYPSSSSLYFLSFPLSIVLSSFF